MLKILFIPFLFMACCSAQSKSLSEDNNETAQVETAKTVEQKPMMDSKKTEEVKKVWVYKHDGSVQCEQKKGRPLEVDKKILQKLGFKILHSQKTTDGMMRAQMCGMPTGAVNAFEISEKDLPIALKKGFLKLGEP